MGYRGQGDLQRRIDAEKARFDAAKSAASLESAVRSLVDPPKRGKDSRANPGRVYTGRLIPGKESRAGSRQSAGHPSDGATPGGGIASPLTETAGNRAYHSTDATMVSSDGMFTLQYRPVSVIEMTDANGAAVTFNYALPA